MLRTAILGCAPYRALLWYWGLIGFLGCCGFLPRATAAPLTLQHQHFLFTFSSFDIRRWERPQEQWTYHGLTAIPPAAFRVDGDSVPLLPDGWKQETITTWDRALITADIQRRIAASLNRPAGSVTVARSSTGNIVFEGLGLPGRSVESRATTELIVAALEHGVPHVTLPVRETPPQVTVTDSSLREAGIREFVTIGESDFTGSPINRRYNIAVGVRRFNGTLIAQGEDFSFNKALGPVGPQTGYRKELVIMGDRTTPDYGGGLCQVSTTAYRGVWEYGFPILKRKNHSFAVRYYGPQGTDATVYPPTVDLQFRNDSPGALVMQTHIEGTKAYFLYYGTRDARTTEIIGPYTWGLRDPPPPKTELTTEIPPGETKKIGDAVPGMHAAWFRIVRREGKETVEKVSSIYEARPLFHQIGVRPEEMPPTPIEEIPL